MIGLSEEWGERGIEGSSSAIRYDKAGPVGIAKIFRRITIKLSWEEADRIVGTLRLNSVA